MNTSIYDKTEKGREEIATRKNQLAARLRTLLLMVDGHKNADSLLQTIGVSEECLTTLVTEGYIVRTGPEELAEAPQEARRAPALRRTAAGLRRVAS